jgi:hypothetical protein
MDDDGGNGAARVAGLVLLGLLATLFCSALILVMAPAPASAATPSSSPHAAVTPQLVRLPATSADAGTPHGRPLLKKGAGALSAPRGVRRAVRPVAVSVTSRTTAVALHPSPTHLTRAAKARIVAPRPGIHLAGIPRPAGGPRKSAMGRAWPVAAIEGRLKQPPRPRAAAQLHTSRPREVINAMEHAGSAGRGRESPHSLRAGCPFHASSTTDVPERGRTGPLLSRFTSWPTPSLPTPSWPSSPSANAAANSAAGLAGPDSGAAGGAGCADSADATVLPLFAAAAIGQQPPALVGLPPYGLDRTPD